MDAGLIYGIAGAAVVAAAIAVGVVLVLLGRSRERARHLAFELGVANGYATRIETRERATVAKAAQEVADVKAQARVDEDAMHARYEASLERIERDRERRVLSYRRRFERDLATERRRAMKAREDAHGATTLLLQKLATAEAERDEAQQQLVGYEAEIELADVVATGLAGAYAQEVERRRTAQRFMEAAMHDEAQAQGALADARGEVLP